ncbi:MAG TPA: hypothetical protein VNJ28_08585 [Candidatus Limnocylindrales bacterium]|nr:hypothetical protein [Candidatus Limnocylindrales bacterium]
MRNALRRSRPVIVSWLVSAALLLVSAASVLADGTGGPWPK